jgi:hypothetical protein
MKTLWYICGLLTTFTLGVWLGAEAQYKALGYSLELTDAYADYNANTEAFIDVIYDTDESFLDTYGSSDEYVDYMESRKKLDSLLWDIEEFKLIEQTKNYQ